MDVENPTRRHGTMAEQQIQAAFDSTGRACRFYDTQMLDHLNARMREFVAAQDMMFVSTADAAGHCDATFRAGDAGFVTVLSATRVTWPEYRGNGVMASLANIADNAHVGLLFVDFFRDVIGLHVNGQARIVDDAAIRAEYRELSRDEVPGRRAERWVLVDVEEAYVHCRKHIPHLARRERARTWGTDDPRSKGGDFFHVVSRDGSVLAARPAGGPDAIRSRAVPSEAPARSRWRDLLHRRR